MEEAVCTVGLLASDAGCLEVPLHYHKQRLGVFERVNVVLTADMRFETGNVD